MKNLVTLFFSVILSFPPGEHEDKSKYVGVYGDWMPNGEALVTELELKDDGTFWLNTVDPIYPQTFEKYESEGKWVIKNDVVVLNPDLQKREPIVSISEKKIDLEDSMAIKINHTIKVFENQELQEIKDYEFDLLTIYFDKKRNYNHLTRAGNIERSCAFAPRIKNRISLDSTNTFKIARKEVKKIGIYTYGFKSFEELEIENTNSNNYEINICISVDKERMPRSKEVKIIGNNAYFYETREGKVDRFLAKPLKKKH